MKLLLASSSIQIAELSLADELLINRVPFLKAARKFNNKTSDIDIILTDDLIYNEDARLILLSLLSLYLDFPQLDMIPYWSDVKQLKKYFNSLKSWDLNTFNTSNLFLGFELHQIHPTWIDILLAKGELQKNPSEDYYPCYLQSLKPATNDELPFKEILEREAAGDFGFELLSKRQIIRKEEHIQQVRKYKPWILNTELTEVWKFTIPTEQSTDRVLLNSELFESNTNIYTPSIIVNHGNNTAVIRSLHKIGDYKIFSPHLMKLFELTAYPGVYLTGHLVTELLTSSWTSSYDGVTILITENYFETLEKILNNEVIKDRLGDGYFIDKDDNYLGIGLFKDRAIIPKPGYTLESWFSECIDSKCVALFTNEKGKLDFIYSRRFEHSMLYCCNVLQPKFNRERHLYDYYESRHTCCFPLFPAGLSLYNNYFVGLQLNSEKYKKQIMSTVYALALKFFIYIKEKDAYENIIFYEGSDLLNNPEVKDFLQKEKVKTGCEFDYFGPIDIALDEEENLPVIVDTDRL